MTESSFFTAAFALYAVSLLVYIAALFLRRDRWAGRGLSLALAGLGLHSVALVMRTVASGHAPFTNMYESLSFFAWAVVVALIVFGRKGLGPRVAPYLMLIVVALMALASSPLMPKDVAPLVPALQSYWLWLHVSVTLVGEAFFAVAFVSSLLFLAADSEERRERFDALAYRAVAVGFPLFTLGGLIFGMVWAYRAWGRYWAWDPKEVWTLITWFVFALYLHTRIVMNWRGRRSAIVALIGFLAALFTYFGVNYLLAGLHSYA